jgi:hypothetical protein
LSEKWGRKSHFSIILFLAVLGVWRFCIGSRLLLPKSMETKMVLMLGSSTRGQYICIQF